MTRRGRENPVVTWPLFWVTVALGLVLNLPDQSNVDSVGEIGLNVLVVVAAVVVMFAVMWVLEPVLMNGPGSQRTLRTFALVLMGNLARASVVARRSGHAVDLVVQDDGAPGEATARPGLGSATLDDVTLRWERRREGGSTVLRATLPCR